MEQEYQNAILQALIKLFQRDLPLINSGTWESSISAKLMCYLQPLFPDHDVDHEYDKYGENAKLITENAQGAERPDIVIHHRNDDSNNLIAIEIKSKPRSDTSDIEKLIRLTDQNFNFRYRYGLHIKFCKAPARIETFSIFRNGSKDETLTTSVSNFLKNSGIPWHE